MTTCNKIRINFDRNIKTLKQKILNETYSSQRTCINIIADGIAAIEDFQDI